MQTGQTTTLLVCDIHLPLDTLEGDVYFMAKKELERNRVHPKNARYRIFRRSVDARKRDRVLFVFTVAVSGEYPGADLLRVRAGACPNVRELRECVPEVEIGSETLSDRPVVVGAGPAGLFAALLLARNGYAPILIERGGDAQERKDAIDRFARERILDTETNVQFGAGGAGMFSDGKLVTRVGDPLTSYVLDTFVEFGAPEEITYLAKPHVGTDLLLGIISRILTDIERLGGTVLFHTRLTGIRRIGSRVSAVKTTSGEIPCGALLLAIGHSARDTYEMLLEEGYATEVKPISVGVRVEHLQEDIDRALYGDFAGHPALGHAEYHLAHDTHTRGVYSFCMCPGGNVIAAASEENTVVVNGMSYHKRDGRNANSAIAVSVFPSDVGNTPAEMIAFQRKIERAAFVAGGSDYSAPIVTMGDFLAGKCGTEPSRIQPTYMNGAACRLASPDAYLPAFVTEALRGAMPAFDRTIHGFSVSDALLTGAETRTSAPLRILRAKETYSALGTENLYPAGEGAGYAGGITSAAIDGLRAALALMRRAKPAGN